MLLKKRNPRGSRQKSSFASVKLPEKAVFDEAEDHSRTSEISILETWSVIDKDAFRRRNSGSLSLYRAGRSRIPRTNQHLTRFPPQYPWSTSGCLEPEDEVEHHFKAWPCPRPHENAPRIPQTDTKATQTEPANFERSVQEQSVGHFVDNDVHGRPGSIVGTTAVENAKQAELVRRVEALESECKLADIRYDRLFLKYQEQVVQRLGPGLWSPRDDEIDKSEFNKLARKINSWAETFATQTRPIDTALSSAECRMLVEALGHVVDLEAGVLPPRFGEGRCPILVPEPILLHGTNRSNAASTVSAFHPLRISYRTSLNQLLIAVLQAGENDAHMWRSDTPRRLRPRTRVRSNKVPEAAACDAFDKDIVRLSSSCTADFLSGPARLLMSQSYMDKALKKASGIFKEAAELSFEVWTQRTFMKFTCLRDLDSRDRVFDLENPRLNPNSLVRYEEHEDKLKGRPVKVVVHPMVDVYGNYKGEGYEERRTWVPAEVWVDSFLTHECKKECCWNIKLM